MASAGKLVVKGGWYTHTMSAGPVSYTHLTLPTSGVDLGGRRIIKKKKRTKKKKEKKKRKKKKKE